MRWGERKYFVLWASSLRKATSYLRRYLSFIQWQDLYCWGIDHLRKCAHGYFALRLFNFPSTGSSAWLCRTVLCIPYDELLDVPAFDVSILSMYPVLKCLILLCFQHFSVLCVSTTTSFTVWCNTNATVPPWSTTGYRCPPDALKSPKTLKARGLWNATCTSKKVPAPSAKDLTATTKGPKASRRKKNMHSRGEYL